MRNPRTLDEIEQEDLAAFCQVSPTLNKAYYLIQDFLFMVHQREGDRLDTWLSQVAESQLPELQSFACGIEKDKDAVKASLTWSINNGVVVLTQVLLQSRLHHIQISNVHAYTYKHPFIWGKR
nr:transposase [Ktedonobacter robiniae]